MKKLILFGAGKIGIAAKPLLEREGKQIEFYVDNDPKKWNLKVKNIPVISMEEYLQISNSYQLILTLNDENKEQVIEQLNQNNIVNYEIFSERRIWERERIISYSLPYDMEDVILYNALYEEKKIFYIDIGSNDPFISSVTKLFYDTKDAWGINIEPQKHLIELTKRERSKDISICVGVGDKCEKARLYYQDGLSTLLNSNVLSKSCYSEEIDIITLEQICDKYINKEQSISFLKIDVEGYEKQVLLGANFIKYRPIIILVESAEPGTLKPNYENWEYIILQNQYHFVFANGVNRYYVANERMDLDNKFIDIETLKHIYKIYHATLEEV